MIFQETSNTILKQKNDDFIDIELLHINRRNFSLFTAACKKNGISAHDAIENFFENYIKEVFGDVINYVEICKDGDIIDEY